MQPVTRKNIFQGRVVELSIETADLPNGSRTALEIVHHPGGAAVVALDERERVCMIRQYRHAVGGWLWEIPAGKLEPDEAPLTTAQRELAEEAGVHATRWDDLGAIVTTPGFCDEVIHLFLARELTRVAVNHEAHEVIEVHWWSRAKLKLRLAQNEIRDAKTCVALQRGILQCDLE